MAKALAQLTNEVHHIATRPIIQVDTGNGGLSPLNYVLLLNLFVLLAVRFLSYHYIPSNPVLINMHWLVMHAYYALLNPTIILHGDKLKISFICSSPLLL